MKRSKFSIVLLCAMLLISCKQNSTDSISTINTWIGITSAIATVFIFVIQLIKLNSERFISYTNHLHSEKDSERIAAAIMLRSYINKCGYRGKAESIIIGLLKDIHNGKLQKILGDGLSNARDLSDYDLQEVNLYNVLIKPESYIKYCSTGDLVYKEKRLSFRNVDFYKANLVELNANSVDFTGAIFYESRLCRSRFRNCIFTNASFASADLDGAKFYDSVLDGANFSGARRVSKAIVYKDKNDKQGAPLIEYLDSDGKFCLTRNKEILYTEESQQKHIFVSRLGLMDSSQQMHYDRIIQYLKNRYGVHIVYLERKDYVKHGQLSIVKDKMSVCSGIIVFAFSYMDITEGVIHKNLMPPSQAVKHSCSFTSPWIQIEAALANSMGIPALVVMEQGVISDGILDDMIVSNDSLLYKCTYDGGLSDLNKSVIAEWYDKIECCKK